jgi:fructokinase
MSGHSPSSPREPQASRIGVDLGGTKIEAILLGAAGAEVARRRIATPRHDYEATIRAIADLVAELQQRAGGNASVGCAIPGSISPHTGVVQNANSTWLNTRPLDRDLEAAIRRPVRLANDANCFALSEATDGAATAARSVFGVIVGTGCGGGIVVDGQLVEGFRKIGGEWGHNPLPWPEASELPGPRCWCGLYGCIETWISGPALAADHQRVTGASLSAEDIARCAAEANADAAATLRRHASRLARGLAQIVNLLDPEVIVLGGGLSKMPHLYKALPALIAPYVFSDRKDVDVRAPRWGDSSGVRGAARLWD